MTEIKVSAMMQAMPTMDSLAFGIGCFHLETGPPGRANDANWAAEAERVFGAIPSISDIRIQEPDSFSTAASDTDAVEWNEDDLIFSPHPNNGTVAFNVRIPYRLQEELGFGDKVLTKAEDFRVLTFYTSGSPVTFVVPLVADYSADAATAVVIVREFLKREVRQRIGPDSATRFTALGPSPFHAECTLRPAEPGRELTGEGFAVERVGQQGYNALNFYYDKSRYTNVKGAVTTLSLFLLPELAFFYASVRRRNRRLFQTRDITGSARALVDLHRSRGVRPWIRRIFTSSSVARELALQVLELELEFKTDIDSFRRDAAYVSESSRISAFGPWLDSELNDDHSGELRNVARTVGLLEARRLVDTNVLLVLITSIMGGVIGAGATALFG